MVNHEIVRVWYKSVLVYLLISLLPYLIGLSLFGTSGNGALVCLVLTNLVCLALERADRLVDRLAN